MDNHTEVGLATYHEIITQTDAWQEATDVVVSQASSLRAFWQDGQYDNVVFTGCGSTYYLSLAASSLWQTLMDMPAGGIPGGELYLYPLASYGSLEGRRTLLVAVSRSGTTSETIAAARQFKARNLGDVMVVTNYDDTPLAELGDVTIAIPAGQEKSVAQTRSFASMYVATTALAATLAGEDRLVEAMKELPGQGKKLISSYESLAKTIGSNLDLDRFYFLGSGPRYGLACEVNLKMKEMTLTHSEPFHFFEFRHGPMSMVTDTAAVVGLLSDARRGYEQAVMEEMAGLGGHTLALGDSDVDISFDSQLPETVRNVLYLPVLQLMAYYRARAKDLNPDQPTNLSAVVELDLDA
ncbi:MAG: SIS domain-containing protein [Chloroflexota bacterium]|nr:SIS domain-containing protein [Chloroflexota bacterium]